MKNALKKPVTAILLAVLMIVLSTMLSGSLKLNAASKSVTDGFYNGVTYDGYKHNSIYSQLVNLCGAADGIVSLAANYEIDCSGVSNASDALKSSISTMHDHISSIYDSYSKLCSELSDIERNVDSLELSSRDADGMSQYFQTVANAMRVIDESGYNESVRNFRSSLGFPADIFIYMCNVRCPEYFS